MEDILEKLKPKNPFAPIENPKNLTEWATKIYEEETRKKGGGSQKIKEVAWLSGLVGPNTTNEVVNELNKLEMPLKYKVALISRSCEVNNNDYLEETLNNQERNPSDYINQLHEIQEIKRGNEQLPEDVKELLKLHVTLPRVA